MLGPQQQQQQHGNSGPGLSLPAVLPLPHQPQPPPQQTQHPPPFPAHSSPPPANTPVPLLNASLPLAASASPSNSESPPEQGLITAVRRGFGFIATPSRTRDIFFHISALEDCGPQQLQEGTAVTFVPRLETEAGGGSGAGDGAGGSGGVGGGGKGKCKLLATRVRLAPVGTRVRMTRVEPGAVLGWVVDPASRGGGGGGGGKGMVRFLDDDGKPEHLVYDAADVVSAVPAAVGSEGVEGEEGALAAPVTSRAGPSDTVAAVGPGATSPDEGVQEHSQRPGNDHHQQDHQLEQQQEQGHQRELQLEQQREQGHQQQPVLLARRQLVRFRVCTDLRAAAMAQEQAAAAAAAAARQHSSSGNSGGGGSSSSGRPVAAAAVPRRMAYQRAVEVRPLAVGELAGDSALRQQAVLLELLDAAVQAARVLRAGGNANTANTA